MRTEEQLFPKRLGGRISCKRLQRQSAPASRGPAQAPPREARVRFLHGRTHVNLRSPDHWRAAERKPSGLWGRATEKIKAKPPTAASHQRHPPDPARPLRNAMTPRAI